MAHYYAVDRRQTLSTDQTIDLVRHRDVQPPVLQEHLDDLFPAGVSMHGELYMLQGSTLAAVVSPVIELVFEYVRRSHFQHRPSRFQSLFASGSVDDARAFRQVYGGQNLPIWEVESSEAFRADMRLLTMRSSLLVLSFDAHRYWAGEPMYSGNSPGGEPSWEYLLTPPVTVLRRIE